MNAYIDLLQQAHDKKWCIQEFCTTCGSMDFRNAAKKLAQQEDNQLASALAALDLSELYTFKNWGTSLNLALDVIGKAEEMDRVLTAWLPQLDQHIRIADHILFYYVRKGALFAPMSIDMLEQWRDKCIELAVRTRDVSLVESLICTIGNYHEYPALADHIQQFVENGSYTIQKALRRRNRRRS